MRISEFCGLTLKDIDLENRIVNIDHQLQRTSDMRHIIETTKTNAGTRKIPITEDVADMFRALIEDRESPRTEKVVDGIRDSFSMTMIATHWWRWAASIQPYGRQVQRYLPGADAEHHTPCMQAYLLFQYGKIGNES